MDSRWPAGFTDNASVTLVPSAKNANTLIAMTETVVGQFKVDRDSLATMERVKYNDSIKGKQTTAHPAKLAGEGTDGTKSNWSINMAYGFPEPQLEVYKYQVGEVSRELLHAVDTAKPGKIPWMHDLAVSKNYIALVECPSYINVAVCSIITASEVFQMRYGMALSNVQRT